MDNDHEQKDIFLVELYIKDHKEFLSISQAIQPDILEERPKRKGKYLMFEICINQDQINYLEKNKHKHKIIENIGVAGREWQKQVSKENKYENPAIVPRGLGKKIKPEKATYFKELLLARKNRNLEEYRKILNAVLKEARSLSDIEVQEKLSDLRHIGSEFHYQGLEPVLLMYYVRFANRRQNFDFSTATVAWELLDAVPVPTPFDDYSLIACNRYMQELREQWERGLEPTPEQWWQVLACNSDTVHTTHLLTDGIILRVNAGESFGFLLDRPQGIPEGFTATIQPSPTFPVEFGYDRRQLALYTQVGFELQRWARSESFTITITTGSQTTSYRIVLQVNLGIHFDIGYIVSTNRFGALLEPGDSLDIPLFASGGPENCSLLPAFASHLPCGPMSWSWTGDPLPAGLVLAQLPDGNARFNGVVALGASSATGKLRLQQGQQIEERDFIIQIAPHLPYLTYAGVQSAIANLSINYPFHTELITLPERSVEGRTIHALRIGKTPGKPTCFFLGGLHARELGSADILINFAADLLEAHSLNSGLAYGRKTYKRTDVKRIVEKINVIILPDANPDGRKYCMETDRNWRKNRNAAYGSGNSTGVDLNRNFDFLFDLNLFSSRATVHRTTSSNPLSSNFQGPYPFSEPETRNVRYILETYKPGWFIDLHSASGLILYSWGDDDNQTTNPSMNFQNTSFNLKRGVISVFDSGHILEPGYREYIDATDQMKIIALGKVMQHAIYAVQGEEYAVIQSALAFPMSGSADDYAYSRHFVNPAANKTLSFTIECGTQVPSDRIGVEKIILDISSALMAFCKEAT
jgi:hypothetical protein